MLRIVARVLRFFIPMILGLSLLGQTSWAAKAYVTDSLRVGLREGPDTENKALRYIASGVLLEVLESEDGWSRVQVDGGEQGMLEGWIMSRYLVARQPWVNQARSLSQQNATLKQEIARMNNGAYWETGPAKKLKEDYEKKLRIVQELTQENKSLRSSQTNKRFATGAFVLFCGLICGLVVGKQQKKPKALYY